MNKNEPSPEREFRVEDAELFLKICDRIADSSGEERDSYRELFAQVGKYSTCLNQLTRFLEYLLPRRQHGVRAPSRVGLEVFFQKEPGKGYALTPLGTALKNRLTALPEFLTDLRSLVATALDSALARRVVRVGAPQTLGLRLLANAFSDPSALQDDAEGDSLPLEVELRMGNTKTDLIPRLRLGLLDFLVGYGLRAEDGYPGEGYFDPDISQGVYFRRIGLDVPMVLLAHPTARIPLRGEESAPGPLAGSGSRSVPDPPRPSIDLRDVDWRRVTLATVPSWRQPRALQEVMDAAERVGRLIEVSQYDDALALARTGGGVAVVSELFSARARVRVFNLVRPEDYTRPIGIYYNAERGLSPDACRYVEFLKCYVRVYRNCLRQKPPALDDEGFPEQVGLDPRLPWEKLAEESRMTASE